MKSKAVASLLIVGALTCSIERVRAQRKPLGPNDEEEPPRHLRRQGSFFGEVGGEIFSQGDNRMRNGQRNQRFTRRERGLTLFTRPHFQDDGPQPRTAPDPYYTGWSYNADTDTFSDWTDPPNVVKRPYDTSPNVAPSTQPEPTTVGTPTSAAPFTPSQTPQPALTPTPAPTPESIPALPSAQPSDSPSESPNVTPSPASQPSAPTEQNNVPTLEPTEASQPSEAAEPNNDPTVSPAPSESFAPSKVPSESSAPSSEASSLAPNTEPSVSSPASVPPTIAAEPTSSFPTAASPTSGPPTNVSPTTVPPTNSLPTQSSPTDVPPTQSPLTPSPIPQPSPSSSTPLPTPQPSPAPTPGATPGPTPSPTTSPPTDAPSTAANSPQTPAPTPSPVDDSTPGNSCTAQTCEFEIAVDQSSGDDDLTFYNATFQLDVDFIIDVKIEISSVYGEDLLLLLVAPTPSQDEYVFMDENVASNNNLGDYDMGLVAGDGTLSNVAEYVFVESGGISGWTAPYTGPGTFNAATWTTSGAPYGVGDWELYMYDRARGDSSSIGKFLISYCGRCPSS